jgi:hypothetical protein
MNYLDQGKLSLWTQPMQLLSKRSQAILPQQFVTEISETATS